MIVSCAGCRVKANIPAERRRVFTYQSVPYHFDRLFALYISVTPTLVPFYVEGFRIFSFILLCSRKVCCYFSSPLLTDKDVTLICFMDIKLQLVRKLPTNFTSNFFKDFKKNFARKKFSDLILTPPHKQTL